MAEFSAPAASLVARSEVSPASSSSAAIAASPVLKHHLWLGWLVISTLWECFANPCDLRLLWNHPSAPWPGQTPQARCCCRGRPSAPHCFGHGAPHRSRRSDDEAEKHPSAVGTPAHPQLPAHPSHRAVTPFQHVLAARTTESLRLEKIIESIRPSSPPSGPVRGCEIWGAAPRGLQWDSPKHPHALVLTPKGFFMGTVLCGLLGSCPMEVVMR